MATCLPKQQTGTKLTKAQKEEHKIWVNLNNFRKQYFMGTIDDKISELFYKKIPGWNLVPIVWDSDEEKTQAKIVHKQWCQKMKQEGRDEVRS